MEEKANETRKMIITMWEKFFFKVTKSFVFAMLLRLQFVFSMFISYKYVSLSLFFSENFARHFLSAKHFTSL